MTMDSLLGNLFAADISLVQRVTLAALNGASKSRDENVILCPVCGYDYVHLIASGVHQNDALQLIASDGTHIVRGMPPLGRGSAVVTIYQCESDQHTFASVHRFHKGRTFRFTVPIGSQQSIKPLWRN